MTVVIYAIIRKKSGRISEATKICQLVMTKLLESHTPVIEYALIGGSFNEYLNVIMPWIIAYFCEST